ncbi:uncharacterized protein C8Q71DRAFT_691194, partial [Rhodofomes roseus]
DSHATHISPELCQYASQHNLHVVGYPPESTDRLQGLDMVHYAQIKRLWPLKVQ